MKVLETYQVESEGVPAEVVIIRDELEFVDIYELRHIKVKEATAAALNYLKNRIIEAVNLKISEILDPRESDNIRNRIKQKANELVKDELSGLSDAEENIIVGRIIQEMMGLGELELILADDNLEEVVVNSASEPVWVYHKRHGWLKSNVYLNSEEQIHNYASIIGRRVGRQITNLNPLMDAQLITGDRVNATLAPISTKGNSLTIRKFAKEPWTIVSLIDNNTLSLEAAALIWEALQYELSVLVAGGTASGKTSFLNSMLVFTPPNQRVVSIEDSVDYCSSIVYLESGQIKACQIGELIDRKILENKITLYDGTEVSFNSSGIKILSVNETGKVELAEPTIFIRHQTSKPMFLVKTESGKSISVTADHSLFCKSTDGKIKSIKTSDLTIGSSVLTVDAINSNSSSSYNFANTMMIKNYSSLTAKPEKVVSINHVANPRKYVYDLSVPKNESFVASNFVAHNTRELVLPDFLHWTPMVTREANPEGKGGIEMLDLMVNSLRMRPDRIVLGEIRRQREAEVLFEAMHTGHSVYSTLHADDAAQTRSRLISPPISLPPSMISALQLIVVQYRQRRKGIRRTFEIAEVIQTEEDNVSTNVVYKWDPRSDKLVKVGEHMRFTNDLNLHTGLTNKEVASDLSDKMKILESMRKNNINKVNQVGRIIGGYYREPMTIVEYAKKDQLDKLLDND